MPEIRGCQVDACGRCRHYHTEVDIVAFWCPQCAAYYACYRCHDELVGHALGRQQPAEAQMLCGACRNGLTYAQYHAGSCPWCHHAFNPRCTLHHDRYFNSVKDSY